MTVRALFSIKEAAEICGVSEGAFRYWVRIGEVPDAAIHRVCNRIRIKAWWLREIAERPAEVAS